MGFTAGETVVKEAEEEYRQFFKPPKTALEYWAAMQYEIKVGKFPMLANSRAKTNREPDGFVKVIADARSDRVLGVWIIASVDVRFDQFVAQNQRWTPQSAVSQKSRNVGAADPGDLDCYFFFPLLRCRTGTLFQFNPAGSGIDQSLHRP